MTPRPIVVALEQTSRMMPSQWEGRTQDGQHIYIHYQHGQLDASIGNTEDEATLAVYNAVYNGPGQVLYDQHLIEPGRMGRRDHRSRHETRPR